MMIILTVHYHNSIKWNKTEILINLLSTKQTRIAFCGAYHSQKML